MPTPPDETGDTQMDDVAIETNTDPPTAESESGAGKGVNVSQSEDPTHSPSVAVPSVSTSESPIAPLNPQVSPLLHPSCTPDDLTIPSGSEAQLPSEQSATCYSPIPSTDLQYDPKKCTDISPVQGETPTYTPQVNTKPPIDPLVLLAQIEAETQDTTYLAESQGHDSVVNPAEILAEIEAETQSYNSNGSEIIPAEELNTEEANATKSRHDSHTDTPHIDSSPTRARSKRSGSVEMFGSFYPAHKIHVGGGSKPEDRGNPQPMYIPGARVKRSGSVEMFGSFYPVQKIGAGSTDGDSRNLQPTCISVPRARVKRSGSVEMFGFSYPEKKIEEGSEDSDISHSDSQKNRQVRRFSIPQARTTRSGSVEMFGFSYPEKKIEEGCEDSDISESDGQKSSQVRRFSIPQARTTRSGSVEMFGFSYPEKKTGEGSNAGDSVNRQHTCRSPWARVKRSGSVEMFGFSYPVGKSGGNSEIRDRSDSDTSSQKSDDLEHKSVPFARVKRSGSVEMFGSFYPANKTGRSSEVVVGDEDQEENDPKPAPVQHVGSSNPAVSLHPIVEAEAEHLAGAAGSYPEDRGNAQPVYVPRARVKRSGSVEMFGSFYPPQKTGAGSNAGDSGNLQPISVPRARVKRSGSVEMFGFSYPENKSQEGSEDSDISESDGQKNRQVRRFSIPQARTTRSGSVEMFGFSYPEKNPGEGNEDSSTSDIDNQTGRQVRRFSIPQARTTRSGSVEMFGFSYPEKKIEEGSEDSDISDSDSQKNRQVRRFSIPQARTTRSGSVEMFGFSYPENKTGEGSNAGDSVNRQHRSPWARVKRSGSVEMFGFSYPVGKSGGNSEIRDRYDSDTSSQKSDDLEHKSVPFARVKRSGSVEMFGSFCPANKTGRSSEVVVGDEDQEKDDPKPAPVQPFGIGNPAFSLHPITEAEAEHLKENPPALQRPIPPNSKEVNAEEENPLGDDPSARPRTKRSGSVDMFGFFDMCDEDSGKQKSAPKPIFVPRARVKRSGSVEMFGFSYPQYKTGKGSNDGGSGDLPPIAVPRARVKRSGSVEMFGFSYPTRKSGESTEDNNTSKSDGQKSSQVRRFSIPQACTTRSGSVEMFGFSYPEKKVEEDSEDSDISESDGHKFGQVRRFSIPQARTTRSGSVEMFGFSYPENKTGEESNDGGVNRQTRSPWFRVKRSGSVEMFGFSYAARLREASKNVDKSDNDDQSNIVNPVETILETESEPPVTVREASAGPRNSTGLPTETLAYLSSIENLDIDVEKTTDTDTKDTQVLRHTDSHTPDTQHSETEHTKSTDSPDKARTVSKDSMGSADFVMIQHGYIWKDLKNDNVSPEEVQVKEKDSEDSGERKGDGGPGSNKEDPGNQQTDGNVNSNHAATEEEAIEPALKIDVPTVSVTVQIRDATDETTTDRQAASNTAAEAEDQVTELPSAVQRRVKPGGGADESKRRSLMLWVDADLVQTVRTEQSTKSPQHSPDDIPSDLKRLKKVIRKERWAIETEHEVRKEVWKQLCLQNSAGASVSHVYTEVEEGLFGKGTGSVDPSSITLPSFVDPDHPVASYALKSEGQTRLNRLLCVLADTRPDILYCPLLAPLAGMLLHYMSSEETFDCLSALLGSSRYKYLEVSWVEHESFRMSFEKLAARFAASAHKMFIKQGDVGEIYQDWIWWILEDLPLSHVIRVMDCYLSEGLKIFYRVGLAILMLYKKHKGTAETPDGVAASIREFVRTIPVSPNTLLTVGFQFRGLSRSVIGTYQTKHKETLREDNSPYRASSRRQQDVITKLNHISSSVITHQQLHTIWGWVPSRFSIYQPSLVFTTQEHGFSLTTFYTRCEYCEPTILLIKTSDQEIFGAFLSCSWSTRNDGDHKGIYFGTGESFLFSLAPEEKKYPWVGLLPKEDSKEEEETNEDGEEEGEKGANGGGDLKKKMNEMFMRASSSLIAVGGGDGDGILIEGDLTKGFSTHCLTFDNPGLAKERSYNCDVIEVITMEDGRNPTNGETA